MAHISDVPHIPYFVTQEFKIPVYGINSDGCPSVANVGIAVYSRSADIHAHKRRGERFKRFYLSGNRSVYCHFVEKHSAIVSKVMAALPWPRWASPYTVGPQTYMPTKGGVSGSKGSFFRESVLYIFSSFGSIVQIYQNHSKFKLLGFQKGKLVIYGSFGRNM